MANDRNINMTDPQDMSCNPWEDMQEAHDNMRKQEVDIGGQETTTKKLMRPQTEQDMED